MSEPNARDYEHARNIVCDENIEGLARAFAAYREEIEAKKTVPMAMLIDVYNMAISDENGAAEHEDVFQIAARYGYEVIE